MTLRTATLLLSATMLATPAVAQTQPPAAPVITPVPVETPTPAPTATPSATPSATPAATPSPEPVTPPEPLTMPWTRSDARALLGVIEGIAAEGLLPADYEPDALRAAIAAGEGDALNAAAGRSFSWLAEDLRDGRTPMAARLQWFAVDPDQDINPTPVLMARALAEHDVPGVLNSLLPAHENYAKLKAELAATPKAQATKRNTIRVNMDRWRWLARDLGNIYLIANVPEFQVRLMSGGKLIRAYRTIVGKPGKTATPQLAEKVKAVVFNPTWTVPQSIVVGEGLGARLIGNPRQAAREGYAVKKLADGTISVVQQPGPNNALGLIKIDMPNEHAIYLHDTPSRGLFNAQVRAFSHGCIRTEDAMRLGITMAILGAGITPDQAVANATSKIYTKVDMTTTFPVYISYFTYGPDVAGKMTAFNDIYKRDVPVIESFAKPRIPHTTQRKSNEAVIKLDNPL